MAELKLKKIGDEVQVDGETKVITAIMHQDAFEGQTRVEEVTHKRPKNNSEDGPIEITEVEVPVDERVVGYLVQDPDLPWKLKHNHWVRASTV